MKNVTTRRLGGFTQGLFKPSWSVWRPAGFQDLPLSNKESHPGYKGQNVVLF